MLTKKVKEKSKLGIKIIALGWCEAKKNCSGHLFLCKEYTYLYCVLYYSAFQGRIQKMAEYFLQGI